MTIKNLTKSLFGLEVYILHCEKQIEGIERDLSLLAFNLKPIQIASLFDAKETYKQLKNELKEKHAILGGKQE